MEWTSVDLDLPWSEQGIAPGAFDLVYAVNVMHISKNLLFSLNEARSALAAGGWLVIGECVRPYNDQPMYPELMFQILPRHAWADLLRRVPRGRAGVPALRRQAAAARGDPRSGFDSQRVLAALGLSGEVPGAGAGHVRRWTRTGRWAEGRQGRQRLERDRCRIGAPAGRSGSRDNCLYSGQAGAWHLRGRRPLANIGRWLRTVGARSEFLPWRGRCRQSRIRCRRPRRSRHRPPCFRSALRGTRRFRCTSGIRPAGAAIYPSVSRADRMAAGGPDSVAQSPGLGGLMSGSRVPRRRGLPSISLGCSLASSPITDLGSEWDL